MTQTQMCATYWKHAAQRADHDVVIAASRLRDDPANPGLLAELFRSVEWPEKREREYDAARARGHKLAGENKTRNAMAAKYGA